MHRAAAGHGEPAALLSPQECLEKIRDKIKSPKICGPAALPERRGPSTLYCGLCCVEAWHVYVYLPKLQQYYLKQGSHKAKETCVRT